jgi:hypothetical protein
MFRTRFFFIFVFHCKDDSSIKDWIHPLAKNYKSYYSQELHLHWAKVYSRDCWAMCWSTSMLRDASCLGCYRWPCSPPIPVSKECVNKHTNAWLAQDSTPRESMTTSLVYTLALHCLLSYHTVGVPYTIWLPCRRLTGDGPTQLPRAGQARRNTYHAWPIHTYDHGAQPRSDADDTTCLAAEPARMDGSGSIHRRSRTRSHGSRGNPQ